MALKQLKYRQSSPCMAGIEILPIVLEFPSCFWYVSMRANAEACAEPMMNLLADSAEMFTIPEL